MGIKEMLSAPRSPWQRAFVERVIVFSEASLRRTLFLYLGYYHGSSPAQSGSISNANATGGAANSTERPNRIRDGIFRAHSWLRPIHLRQRGAGHPRESRGLRRGSGDSPEYSDQRAVPVWVSVGRCSIASIGPISGLRIRRWAAQPPVRSARHCRRGSCSVAKYNF